MKSGQTCTTCNAFSAIAKECRAEAPKAQLIPDGAGSVRTISYFPPTSDDKWCRRWQADEQEVGS